MLESVYRSPKWLRNFMDFEISTGDDIKGEPSIRKKKKMEKDAAEERKRAEEERIRKKKEAYEKAKEERKKSEKERSDKADIIFRSCIQYIFKNYKSLDVTINPGENSLTMSNKDDLSININNIKHQLHFSITLLNSYTLPTFDVHFRTTDNYDIEEDYYFKISGFDYSDFKIYILKIIYPYYQIYSKKSSRSSYGYKKSSDSGSYSSSKNRTNKKTYSEEDNKKRRYDLLKTTLDGYKRQLSTILDWERKNHGKIHDDKNSIMNEIENIKDKIEKMKKEYKFESFKHLTSFYEFI